MDLKEAIEITEKAIKELDLIYGDHADVKTTEEIVAFKMILECAKHFYERGKQLPDLPVNKKK